MSDKNLNKLFSYCISFNFTYLLFGLVGVSGLVILPLSLVSAIIPSFICYKGLTTIGKKLEENKEKENSHLLQILLMENEIKNPSIIKKYTKTTASFFELITDKLNTNNLTLDEESIFNINQFLYLINSNYYEEIHKYLKKTTRKDLLNNILDQVIMIIKDNNLTTFTDQNINKVVDNSLFIKEKLKVNIKEEWKNSVYKVGKNKTHAIKRNDNLSISSAIMTNNSPTRNINYNYIIDYYLNNEYLNTLGDVSIITWDMSALDDILELLLNNTSSDKFKFTSSYIYNVFIYALVNKRTNISYNELIRTLASWDYISIEELKRIRPYLIEKLDNKKKLPLNNKQKIINFNERIGN